MVLKRAFNVLVIALMIITLVPLCIILTPLELLYYIFRYIFKGTPINFQENPCIIKLYSYIYDRLNL